MQKPSGARIGFLTMAFLVVGLVGLFSSFAAPLPLQRAFARDAALDAALAALHGPDPQAAIEALRPRLDDSADALLPVSGDMVARIAQERAAMHARFLAEADATDVRLHWLICVVTVMGALFGAAVLGIGVRGEG